jgi:hypothetical protein
MQIVSGRCPSLLGWDISFTEQGDGHCVVRLKAGRFNRRHKWVASPADMAVLEAGLVQQLTRRRLLKPKIDVKMDFYGGQWLEVRRGLFGRTNIRAAPERLNRICAALNLPV